MAIGSSQTSGQQITGLLGLSLKPDPATSIAPGLVVVNISATDDKYVGLPNNSAALLNGRAFAGILEGFNATAVAGTNQPADNQILCQRDGIAKAQLKASTACTAGQRAAYDPADGGYVVPYTSAFQVCIGKFTQSKASSSDPQFVGVELTPGAAGLVGGGLLLFAAPEDGTVSSTSENIYSNATFVSPANFFRVGDVVSFGATLIVSNQNGSDTLQVRWKIGSTTIVQTVSTYNPATADGIYISGTLAFDDLGATASVNIGASAVYGAAATAGVAVAGAIAPTVDTTAAITLTLTAQWNASSANNQCDLKNAWYRLDRKSA